MKASSLSNYLPNISNSNYINIPTNSSFNINETTTSLKSSNKKNIKYNYTRLVNKQHNKYINKNILVSSFEGSNSIIHLTTNEATSSEHLDTDLSSKIKNTEIEEESTKKLVLKRRYSLIRENTLEKISSFKNKISEEKYNKLKFLLDSKNVSRELSYKRQLKAKIIKILKTMDNNCVHFDKKNKLFNNKVIYSITNPVNLKNKFIKNSTFTIANHKAKNVNELVSFLKFYKNKESNHDFNSSSCKRQETMRTNEEIKVDELVYYIKYLKPVELDYFFNELKPDYMITNKEIGSIKDFKKLIISILNNKLKVDELSDILTNPEFNFNLESNIFGQFNLVDSDNLIDVLNKENLYSFKNKENTKNLIGKENISQNETIVKEKYLQEKIKEMGYLNKEINKTIKKDKIINNNKLFIIPNKSINKPNKKPFIRNKHSDDYKQSNVEDKELIRLMKNKKTNENLKTRNENQKNTFFTLNNLIKVKENYIRNNTFNKI